MKLTLREQLAANFLHGILAGSYSSSKMINGWNFAAESEGKVTPVYLTEIAFNYADAFMAKCKAKPPEKEELVVL